MIPGPLSKLPDEIVRHVLSFAPIDSVFSSMRVDRKWESAARYEVRHGDTLTLRPLANCNNCKHGTACMDCRKIRFTGRGIGINGIKDYAVIQSLSQMKKLKYLILKEDSNDRSVRNDERFVSLIFQNAGSLVSVKGFARLPVLPSLKYMNLEKLECDFFDEEVAGACPRLRLLVFKRFEESADLSQVTMPCLEQLVVQRKEEQMVDFAARHAGTLTSLTMHTILVKRNGQRIVYPKMQQLNIGAPVDSEPVDEISFPRLSHVVMTKHKIGVIRGLPAEQMEHLVLSVTLRNDEEVGDIVASLSRLTNLQMLDITLMTSPVLIPMRTLADRVYAMFEGINGRESFSFTCQDRRKLNLERAIERLVQQNPALESLTLERVKLTDIIIAKISTLTRLQELHLEPSGYEMPDLMPLTTGATRHSLLTLEYMSNYAPVDELDQEFRQMLKERGLKADEINWITGPDSICFSAQQ